MSDINALRTHLFDALEGLKSGKIDVAHAKAMAEIGGVIIDSAKVEVDYLRVTGGKESTSFIPALPGPSVTPTTTGQKTVDGNVTTHKLK